MSKEEIKEAVKTLQTVVCDDIRREDSGKFLLVGVYSHGIIAHELPAKLNLSLWVNLEILVSKETKVEIQIAGSALEKPQNLEFTIADEKIFGKSTIVPLFIVGIPLEVTKEGKLDISYSYSGDKKRNLFHSMPVTYKKIGDK